MSERSKLTNGRFLHDLDGWTASGAEYSAGDGDDHYGVAVIGAGEYLTQTFAVSRVRVFTLHVSAKAAGSDLSTDEVQAVITDGDGNAVVSFSLEGTADTWTENTDTCGLAPGTQYTLKLINNSFGADVKLDDVWLWFIPITRASIATQVDAKLARLASERSLSTTADGSLTEGDYTYAIDAALRTMGAINPETGKPDIRYLDAETVQVCIDEAEHSILEQLQRDYAVETDLTTGPRTERRSQIAENISGVLGDGDGGGQGQAVIMRKMTYDS